MVDPADTVANWGDQITFKITTTATTEPNVSVTCKQSGVVVYGAVAGFYDSYPWPWTKIMTLSSQSWTGGSASCVAELYYFSGTSTVGARVEQLHCRTRQPHASRTNTREAPADAGASSLRTSVESTVDRRRS